MNHRTKAFVAALAIIATLAFARGVCFAEASAVPFEIPPDGQGEKLIGELDYDITAGFSAPAPMADGQTYCSLVCDTRNRLHSAFRQWQPHATLCYQRRFDHWSEPKTLVHGANTREKWMYGVFYHRMFIDRDGALYISFTFYENVTQGEGDYPRALIVSVDGGDTWQLADRERFARRVFKKPLWKYRP